MTHPQLTASHLETDIVAMRSLLTESLNDEKAALIKIVKRAEQAIKDLRNEMTIHENKLNYEQEFFCDQLTFEFSVNADFSGAYIRTYENACFDSEILKSIVNNERKLQNMGDQLLFARVTIIDNDPEV